MATELDNKVAVKTCARLFLQSKSADIYFAFTTNGEIVKVPAHKAILAAASTVFDAMFYGTLKENDVVEIVDASASAFEEFLQLFYLPKVTISMENIDEVVRLADKYDMTECLNACVKHFERQLSKDNTIWAYQLAIVLNNQPLKDLCESQIKKFTYYVIKSESIRHCDKLVLENILSLEPLCCEEMDLFMTCFEWAKSTCEANGLDGNNPMNLKNELGDLFHLNRFDTMTYDEIATILSDEQKRQLFSRDELSDIICMKSNKDFESKAFKSRKRSKRCFHWNSKEVLKCKFEAEVKLSYPDPVPVQSTESTRFSVNVPVIFVALECDNIYRIKSDEMPNISSKMSIVEYEKQSFQLPNASEVLHVTTVEFTEQGSPSVALPPIAIQPGKMYEIRYELPTDGNQYEHTIRSKSDIKLDEEVMIKFHVNPNELYSVCRGVVFSLSFNRI